MKPFYDLTRSIAAFASSSVEYTPMEEFTVIAILSFLLKPEHVHSCGHKSLR